MNRDQTPRAGKTATTDDPGPIGGTLAKHPSTGDAKLDGTSLSSNRSSKKSELKVTYLRDIETTAPKRWLVQGMFGAGELSCLYGHPSSTKSLIAADLAFSIAAGLSWFSRKTFHGSVLYVAAERGSVVKRRLHALKLETERTDAPLALVTGSIDLQRNSEHTLAISEIARQLAAASDLEVALIVIDTINRALAGGEENSSTDMGRLIQQLTKLQEITKAHILTVHHMPVDGTRMRGHSSFLGACDTTALVEKFDDVCTVTVKKANDGPEGELIAFTLKSIDLHQDAETGEITTAPVVVPTKLAAGQNALRLTKNERAMLEILLQADDEPLTREEWNERALDAGIGGRRPATRSEAKKSLFLKGLVSIKDGKCIVDGDIARRLASLHVTGAKAPRNRT